MDLTFPGTESMLAKITCSQYHAMIAAGALRPEDKIELINGYLIKKMSIGSNHAGTVNVLVRLLTLGLGENAIVAVKDPIEIHEYSEPEPDISVLRNREDYYRTSHPQPKDVFLVIEVADSSLAYDRGAKVPLYAATDIPEVWLVDLVNHQHIVHRKPDGAAYAEQLILKHDDHVSIPGFPDVRIALADLGL